MRGASSIVTVCLFQCLYVCVSICLSVGPVLQGQALAREVFPVL